MKTGLIWFRRIALFLCCCQTVGTAGAADWVNFRPSEWDRSAAVCSLAHSLAAEAETQDELPRLVHSWICENIYFDEDAFAAGIYVELSAGETLKNRKGVCESIANLTQSLLLEAGIPCIKVWGAAIPEDTLWTDAEIDPERINHTWNEYYIDGQWRTMDCMMDMGNRYFAGEFFPGAWKEVYFNPTPGFFAETHRSLQRGFTLPEDIPDNWAMPEIEEAAQCGIIPLIYFGSYRRAVTAKEFCEMLGLADGTDMLLSRGSAAVILAGRMEWEPAGDSIFTDIWSCTEHERQAIMALEQLHLTAGTGSQAFSPQAAITRQEAIVMITRLLREDY